MSKLVRANIIPGVRLPHNIEGVQIDNHDQLIELADKQRLMALRPNLFSKKDADWPAKVASVELREIVEEEPKPKVVKVGNSPA